MPKLAVEPCAINPGYQGTCYAVPLQPGKPNYDRALNGGDICFAPDEYAAIQKQFRQAIERCGDRCN